MTRNSFFPVGTPHKYTLVCTQLPVRSAASFVMWQPCDILLFVLEDGFVNKTFIVCLVYTLGFRVFYCRICWEKGLLNISYSWVHCTNIYTTLNTSNFRCVVRDHVTILWCTFHKSACYVVPHRSHMNKTKWSWSGPALCSFSQTTVSSCFWGRVWQILYSSRK